MLVPTVVCVASMLSSSCAGQQVSSQVEEHFRAAQQDQQAGLLDAAEREYRTILQLQPGVPEVYADLGLIYYAQAKFGDSAQAFATAGKLKPGMRGVSLWLGIDYVKLNQSRRSIPLLREAVGLDPADKQAQSWLGMLDKAPPLCNNWPRQPSSFHRIWTSASFLEKPTVKPPTSKLKRCWQLPLERPY